MRTVLALATKDDLSVSIDEGTDSFDPANARRTQRYRTNNQIDIEVTQALSTDQSALNLLGIVDDSGALDFSSDARELGSDAYLEIAYSSDELDYSNDPGPSEFELVHRASDVEVLVNDIDPSTTPPTIAFTAMVEGDFIVNAASIGSTA
ncbi:hypothetical protein Z052_02050 [Halorubrum sp. C191]|nr:hypothetical protein Z052_02050 [Halorubrum sp. C191]